LPGLIYTPHSLPVRLSRLQPANICEVVAGALRAGGVKGVWFSSASFSSAKLGEIGRILTKIIDKLS